MLLLYPVALERARLVGITVGLTLTSSVTDLNKKTISRYSCLKDTERRVSLIGFLAEERQVEDIFCSPALNPFYLSTGTP